MQFAPLLKVDEKYITILGKRYLKWARVRSAEKLEGQSKAEAVLSANTRNNFFEQSWVKNAQNVTLMPVILANGRV